jgi:hypothetical protein
MERIWAAIDGGTISNTFVGDDAFADLVRPDHDEVVEITDLSSCPGIQWTVHPDGYRPPSPFPSWEWTGTEWEAPTPMPTDPGAWNWDENAEAWIDLTPVTE